MNKPKRFIFESTEKTLYETNDISDMCNFINHNYPELIQREIMHTTNYIHILYVGYTLMIRKNYANEFGLWGKNVRNCEIHW